MSQHSSRGRPWERIRAAALDRAGWRCSSCGRAGRLEVHHRDGDPKNNAPGNLTVRCRSCHFGEHGRTPPPEVAGRRAWRRLLSKATP